MAACVFLEVNRCTMRNEVGSHLQGKVKFWFCTEFISIPFFIFILDVLASQDQSGGDATVTIDQRKCSSEKSAERTIKGPET